MTEQDINKAIAEYMGYGFNNGNQPNDRDKMRVSYKIQFHGSGQNRNHKSINGAMEATQVIPKYTTSLDACIPVVEKLNRAMSFYFSIDFEFKYKAYVDVDAVVCKSCSHIDYEYAIKEDNSPAVALATALAKAIKKIR